MKIKPVLVEDLSSLDSGSAFTYACNYNLRRLKDHEKKNVKMLARMTWGSTYITFSSVVVDFIRLTVIL